MVEALDDFVAHRPIRLYAYRVAQIDMSLRTPGLECPDAGLGAFEHVFIDDAGISESYLPTWIELRRGEAARSFAYLYNVTVLETRGAELRCACPKLIRAAYRPRLYYRREDQ